MYAAVLPERIAVRIIIHECGCHLWTGATNRDGYGIVSYEGKSRLVHRVVYELATGQPIPPQHVLDHRL